MKVIPLILSAATAWGALASPAHSHAWYSQRVDPVHHTSCCGGTDCHELDGRFITAETDGLRIRLTAEQAKAINPNSHFAIDALVIWDRVQASEDGNYHICLFNADRSAPRGGVICLFAPPTM